MLTGLLRWFVNSLVILLGVCLLGIGLLGLSGWGLPAASLQVWSSPPTDMLPAQEAPLLDESTGVGSATAAQSPAEIPNRLQIPAIQLDAPVVPAVEHFNTFSGDRYLSWRVPEGYLVGWHGDSARLGEGGNIVLNGHHNVYGQVFAHLVELEGGEEIRVFGELHEYRYRITEKLLLPERGQPIEVRLENARWILPTAAPRLTLVTCWPYETNTHRLILIAEPW